MADRNYRIHEDVITDKRLGRHVAHDPRSLSFKIEPRGSVVSARWGRQIPVLNQGNLGSCTANATVGALGTEPYYSIVKAAFPDLQFTEQLAVHIYSLATEIDDVPGTYPPTDSGSTGLAVAKIAQQMGLISGYLHITSIAAAHTAIASGPFITGTAWLSGMDEPDANGLVHATGSLRGGHEYEVIGFDATSGLWEFVNSWGTEWGAQGRFFLSDADYAKLLADDGDATQFVPLTQPAPTPTPTPQPTPGPVSPTPDVPAFPVALVQPWLDGRHIGAAHTAQAAIKHWLAAGGH